MLDRLRQKVLATLRVPPDPELPDGSPGSALIFRAGRNFYRIQVLRWAFSHLGVIASLVFAYFFTWRLIERFAPYWVRFLYEGAEVLGLLGVAVVLPFTFLALKWEYELRWYIVTDRSVRIRRGVWNVEELTMTFMNIQQIRVTSGPIQKLLGIADVEVSSAGGGAAGPRDKGDAHSAIFEGVDKAGEIRDLMTDRLRAYRDHPDAVASMPGASATLAASQAVLQEARALRSALMEI